MDTDADIESVERFLVKSGYGSRTRQPLVFVTLGEHNIQVSPADARKMAANLLECAEAADQDAFLMSFAQKRLGLDDRNSGLLLLAFRKDREKGKEHE